MKDQFETKIKSIVEEFSYDYDPKAWEALSKKLPAPKGGLSWLAKFGIASMLALVVGTFVWVNLTNEPEKSVQTSAIQKHTSKQENRMQPVSKVEKQSNQQKHLPNEQQRTFISAQFIESEFIQSTFAAPYVDLGISALNTEGNSTQQIENELNTITTPLPLGVIQQNTQQNLANNQTQKPGNQTNCQGPKITLDADAINYEEGTPRIKISADCNGSEISWSANGTLVQKKNRSVELLAFKGQTYTITAQAQLDGCISTEKIKITANEDYNLLAVNAFNPQSRDERNATFMPYALTIRDVRFELLIIDPDNGAVVFKTTDAQNAWDGIDVRNGQLVPAQKAFIWKVVLQDALPNEKTHYSGTIVRI